MLALIRAERREPPVGVTHALRGLAPFGSEEL